MNPYPETKRPIRVDFLILLVLVVTACNGLRLYEAIFFWKTLEEYGTFPAYITISGGVWFITGLLLFWGMWRGKSSGWFAALCGTAGYTAWYWFDRLVLQEPRANWPFVLVVNIIFLLLIFFIIFSRGTRRYYKKDSYGR
jgi:hypothetical protein